MRMHKYVQIARHYAERCPKEHIQLHICMLIYKKQVMSIHSNSEKHAEVEALQRLINRHHRSTKKRKFNLLVCRFSRNLLKSNNSKPCCNCRRFIKDSKLVKNIYYTDVNDHICKLAAV